MTKDATQAQRWFPVIAIGMVVMLVAAAGVGYWWVEERKSRTRMLTATRLRQISQAIVAYAHANQRQFPDHVGRLIAGSYATPDLFLNPENRDGAAPSYAGEPRPGPVYRFGDFIFLYPEGTIDTSPAFMVAVSAAGFDLDGWRWDASADGSVRMYRGYFSHRLAEENATRKAAGLREIDIKEIEALDGTAGATP